MNKKLLILFIIVAVIVGIIYITMTAQKKSINIEYLESVQLNPPDNYIQDLESIVKNDNADPYIRERAIFTLTDVSISRNETDKIIGFLSGIAMDEKEDNIRTSAYANLDLIREAFPLEKRFFLDLSISGKIKKDSIINISTNLMSKGDGEAIFGFRQLDQNIVPLSQPFYKVNLKANAPNEFKFELQIKKAGKYVVPFSARISFDRIDFEEINKEIYLDVGEQSGSFEIIDP
jgi:hypothetical protein